MAGAEGLWIAAAVFTIFWVIFNVFDQLLFFSPVVTFYLPEDAVTGFIITNVTSVLMGILVAMNVYVIRNSKIKLDRSLFSGSIQFRSDLIIFPLLPASHQFSRRIP